MTGWIVTHIPAGLLLVGLIVLIAGGAVLIQRGIRRRTTAHALPDGGHRRHHRRNESLLVIELEHPFIGDIPTSPDPLQEVVRVLDQTAA
jgi:hypothetical protein